MVLALSLARASSRSHLPLAVVLQEAKELTNLLEGVLLLLDVVDDDSTNVHKAGLAHAVVVVEEDAEVVDAAHKDGVDPADGVPLVDTGLPQLAGPSKSVSSTPFPTLGMFT
jgi:hypothetical protein